MGIWQISSIAALASGHMCIVYAMHAAAKSSLDKSFVKGLGQQVEEPLVAWEPGLKCHFSDESSLSVYYLSACHHFFVLPP